MTNDRRKHATQMTESEKRKLMELVSEGSYSLDAYSIKRMAERKISKLDIAITLSKGEVIEAHNNIKNDVRVLVRKSVNGKDCCVVVSIVKKRIVTCYWNESNDKHETLNSNLYKWNTNLLPILGKVNKVGGRLSL